MKFSHIPVLLTEVISGLSVISGAWYIDATVGGGSYTIELLKQGAKVLGIDADRDAIESSKERIVNEMPDKQEHIHWQLIHSNYRYIKEICTNATIKPEGIVFDLGVSSYQLNTPEKGFSFRFEEAPLDLRLDQSRGITASIIIQTESEENLYEIFATYGEEERSRAIAHAIVSARRIISINTTGQLKEVIQQVVPKGLVDETCARVFQALRIEVNDELGALKQALNDSNDILSSHGRLAVVSFHSLEDRIVKRQMRMNVWKQVTKEPIRPTEEELMRNRRSRSAKLRIAEKRTI